jgi:hypothetical protein
MRLKLSSEAAPARNCGGAAGTDDPDVLFRFTFLGRPLGVFAYFLFQPQQGSGSGCFVSSDGKKTHRVCPKFLTSEISWRLRAAAFDMGPPASIDDRSAMIVFETERTIIRGFMMTYQACNPSGVTPK